MLLGVCSTLNSHGEGLSGDLHLAMGFLSENRAEYYPNFHGSMELTTAVRVVHILPESLQLVK